MTRLTLEQLIELTATVGRLVRGELVAKGVHFALVVYQGDIAAIDDLPLPPLGCVGDGDPNSQRALLTAALELLGPPGSVVFSGEADPCPSRSA